MSSWGPEISHNTIIETFVNETITFAWKPEALNK